MDCVLNLKLNLAHQQDRKSIRAFNSGNIEFAVQCHKIAADLLLEALQTTESLKAKDSLELQRQYHLRQQVLVCVKYRVSQNRKKARKMEKEMAVTHPHEETKTNTSHDELRSAFIKELMQFDSLFAHFSPLDEIIDVTKMSRSDTHLLAKPEPKPIVKKTHFKEELELHNRELKKIVNRLCEELENCQKENQGLRETVSKLEKQVALVKINQQNPIDDLFSPLCEITPGGGIRELPALAPLELPTFDYESLKK